MALPIQLPIGVDIVVKKFATGREHYFMTDDLADYLTALGLQIANAAQQLTAVALVGQTASIAPSPFLIGSTRSTKFRVSYVAQVEQAATTNSSLTVKVSYVANGFTVVQSGTPMTSNDPTLPMSGEFIIVADSQTVSYVIDWVSVGATPMEYRVHLFIEALP